MSYSGIQSRVVLDPPTCFLLNEITISTEEGIEFIITTHTVIVLLPYSKIQVRNYISINMDGYVGLMCLQSVRDRLSVAPLFLFFFYYSDTVTVALHVRCVSYTPPTSNTNSNLFGKYGLHYRLLFIQLAPP